MQSGRTANLYGRPAPNLPRQLSNLGIYNLITIATRLGSTGSDIMVKHHGLGVSEFRILRMLSLEPDIDAARIADVGSAAQSVVSRGLSALRAKGFVQRRPDAKAPRRSLWALTPSGLAKLEEALESILAREELLWTGFTEIERLVAIQILQRFLANTPLVSAYKPSTLQKAKHR